MSEPKYTIGRVYSAVSLPHGEYPKAPEMSYVYTTKENDELREVLKEVLDSQVIRSDKDNMEFDYRLSCFTVDKMKKLLAPSHSL